MNNQELEWIIFKWRGGGGAGDDQGGLIKLQIQGYQYKDIML